MLTTKLVGERIRDAREKKEISQKLFCSMLKECGVEISRETLSKIENGSRMISAIELKKIANVLCMNPESLLEEEEEQDLIVLFRKYGKLDGICGEDISVCIEELEEVQYFIKGFIRQKMIYEGV